MRNECTENKVICWLDNYLPCDNEEPFCEVNEKGNKGKPLQPTFYTRYIQNGRWFYDFIRNWNTKKARRRFMIDSFRNYPTVLKLFTRIWNVYSKPDFLSSMPICHGEIDILLRNFQLLVIYNELMKGNLCKVKCE